MSLKMTGVGAGGETWRPGAEVLSDKEASGPIKEEPAVSGL